MADARVSELDEAPASGARTRYRVTGIDCSSCGQKIDTAIRQLPGVWEVNVSAATGIVSVEHEPALASTELEQQIRQLGYGVARAGSATGTDQTADSEWDDAAPWWRSRKATLIIACGLALVAAYLIGRMAPATERWAFLVALSVGLIPIARRAIAAALRGMPFTIETLMDHRRDRRGDDRGPFVPGR